MELRLVKLKSDFNNIITIRNNVKNVFDILQIRIDRLRQFYHEFIQNNKNEMFVFGLDSFHFQSKLIDIEYDDMKRLFLAINNRMYCEYFKLHKIIVEYISKNVNDKKISDVVRINNYPIYKDLEPFKDYKFEIILDIHENILNLLGILMSILNNKINELDLHKSKQNIGLNIDNFITSFNFNISVMREKIIMFITYIEFFHKMHSKYLKRFSNKIQLMYTHISNDIQFDDTVEISKNKKKELIEEFNLNNIDHQLLKDLKTSIGSETNSETSVDIVKSELTTPDKEYLNESKINNYFTSVSKNNKFISPILSINREKSNSIYDEKSIEKIDYKKLFQKNVHKVSDMLQLCKPKKETVIDPKISDVEINRMFSGIEESCDYIIFEKQNTSTDNIGLQIDSLDIYDDIKLETVYREPVFENKIYNKNDTNDTTNTNDIKDIKDIKDANDTNDIINKEDVVVKNNIINKEDVIEKNDIINKEDVIEQTLVEEKMQEDIKENKIINEELFSPVIETSEPEKKKRSYNKKKK